MKDTTVQDSRKLMCGWPARAAAMCAVMAAMPLFAADFPNQIKWDTAVHDGYIDDVANWKNATALPGDGETQTFDLSGTSGDYTVRVRRGETVAQKAHFYVVNLPKNAKFTFDVTGAKYVQTNAQYLANWQAFGFFHAGTSHWFNFENIVVNSARPVLTLEDAVIEARHGGGTEDYTFTLKRGTLSSYNHVGDAGNQDVSLIFGNRGDTVDAWFGEGTHFEAFALTQRGGTIPFTGGDHEVRSYLRVGDAYAFNPRTEISGGSLTVYDEAYIGNYTRVKSATLDVSGDARFIAKKRFHIGPQNMSSNSAAIFRENSVSTLAGVYAGDGTCRNAFMSVTNSAIVTSDNIYVPRANNSTGTVDVAGISSLAISNGFGVATGGSFAKGRVFVRENATLFSKTGLVVGGNGDDVDGEVRIGDDAVFTTGVPTSAGNVTAGSGDEQLVRDERYERPHRACGRKGCHARFPRLWRNGHGRFRHEHRAHLRRNASLR